MQQISFSQVEFEGKKRMTRRRRERPGANGGGHSNERCAHDRDPAGIAGDEKVVFLDAGQTGGERRAALKDRDINWQVTRERGKLKVVSEGSLLGQPLRELQLV